MRRKTPACFRDLGGLPCAQGKLLKKGLLFRSGHLGKISPRDAARLHEDWGIRHIVDLRSDSELADIRDVVDPAMEYHRFITLDDTRNPAVTPKTRMRILQERMDSPGGTLGHLSRTYRDLVRLEDCRQAYQNLIRLAAREKGGILWHCTQGKDRTGMGSVILLLALGADRDTILRDYMAYNDLCKTKNNLIFFGVSIIKFSRHVARSLSHLMCAREAYLEAAFDEMEKTYGSVDGYLREGLGLTGEDLDHLRAVYLT